MKKYATLLIATLGFSLLVVGGIASCKQGLGDRCQVDEDCEDDLTCNQATNPPSCSKQGTGVPLDAAIIIDAPDAPTDAPIDAAPDA
ncbi:MAG: hypothetical protein ACTHU0_08700 [Kofleriaceae bacterium]